MGTFLMSPRVDIIKEFQHTIFQPHLQFASGRKTRGDSLLMAEPGLALASPWCQQPSTRW